MRIYVDFEFSEHFKLGWNLRYYHTIELIQIGMKAEDGRTYMAINKNFNPKHANQWVKDNVLPQIILNYVNTRFGQERKDILKKLEGKTIEKNFRFLQRRIGKPQKQIAAEIFDFVNPDLGYPVEAYSNSKFADPNSELSLHFKAHNVHAITEHISGDTYQDRYYAHPTFVGYFGSYDWVLFCSLFGTMIQLPPGFPMYMVDLKQTMDEIILARLPRPYTMVEYFEKEKELKKDPNYPEHTSEHDALADAKWNEKLDLFLQSTDERAK